jgi:hypothetical protein
MPAGEKLHKLLMVHVEELVQIHATVRKLPEGPLLLQIHCIGVICHDVFSCRSESSNISLVVLERTWSENKKRFDKWPFLSQIQKSLLNDMYLLSQL